MEDFKLEKDFIWFYSTISFSLIRQWESVAEKANNGLVALCQREMTSSERETNPPALTFYRLQKVQEILLSMFIDNLVRWLTQFAVRVWQIELKLSLSNAQIPISIWISVIALFSHLRADAVMTKFYNSISSWVGKQSRLEIQIKVIFSHYQAGTACHRLFVIKEVVWEYKVEL